MEELEHTKAYFDDLLIVSEESFDNHLFKLEKVLCMLSEAGSKVNAIKSTFGMEKVYYLGCALTCKGIEPQPEKVSANVVIKRPNNVQELRCFLDLVQCY